MFVGFLMLLNTYISNVEGFARTPVFLGYVNVEEVGR
jgi:hypothetical protein